MPNLYKNKVVKSTGETLIDLTSDTVTAETLLQDVTAHDRSGAQITGTVIVAPTDVTEAEDNTAYLYKNSEHDAVYDELVGGSVAWNQLLPNGNFESTSGWIGRYSTVSASNNICTVTPSSAGTLRGLIGIDTTETVSQNHKLLLSVYVLSPITTNVGLSLNGNNQKIISVTANVWKKCECVWTNDAATPKRLYALIMDNLTTSQSIQYKNVFIIDLTQMFGSTIADYVYNLEQSTAGSGIAWFKSYGFFTEDYYAYNAGGLVSANVNGKKVVGKNLLEITANLETINGVTFIVDKEAGTIIVNGTATATTFFGFNLNLALNLPRNVELKLTGCPSGGGMTNYQIDLRNSVGGTIYNNAADNGNGATFTVTGDGCNVANIRIQNGYTCNNLVFKPMIRRADVTDSTFEPYTSITYPIQSTDLRGLYKLSGNKLTTDGDIYSADGQITRKYGIVDLGSLEWNKDVASNVFYTSSTELPKKTGKTNILCQKYTIVDKPYTTLSNKEITGESQTQRINIKDDDYSTSGAFKTAMSGVYLIYELATPTTETAQPFTSPEIVYRNGTEEYLDTRDVPMPVGGNRKYVDIPEWMVNQYFDDLRAEASNVSDIIEKLRRIDVSNGSSTTVSTIYAPDDSNGIRTTVRNNRTEVQVACGQASNANGKVVFTDSEIYGGIGYPTSASVNHFMFNDDCVGDSIGKLSSGSPLTGSEFDLNYETINLNGSTINIDDNMSIGFETIDDYTVNTIKSPYIAISTDGISLSPKTLNQFALLISGLPSGSGSELVVNSNGVVYQSSSSRDIKHDIQYVEDTDSYHNALMQIKPATYVYNNDKTEATKLGMIAEDIADVMPIAALTGESGKVENYDTRAVIAMLIMEVQRLNAEIKRLRGDSDAD
jgi:hypothetical protein